MKSYINPYAVLNFGERLNIDKNALRNDKYESKLYHSDFYQPKFVYDSFGFNFALERIDPARYSQSGEFNVDYHVTTTINSRFLFSFPEYILSNATEDYSNILYVSRNNDITLYNSQYLNYLRNGYNYDVKNKNLQLGTDLATIVIGAVGTAAGIASGQVYLTAAGVAGLATSLTKTISSRIQAENNIQSKQQQAKNQATSVQGADDIDLMEAYSENRAKMVIYKCSDQVKHLVSDLFYYCGYTDNVQDKPNTNSRYWFNFVQCDPTIEEPGNLSEDVVNDLKLKYNEGVSFMHVHRDLIGQNPQWDLDQVKENWETSLM